MSQEDWLRHRKQGIGASEVAVVLGLSPYKASIQLFYEKVGEDLGFSIENLSKFLGKEQEPFLATLWEYWDPQNPGHDQMIANYRADRKIRRCKRVNAYAHNPAYPWLFVSLDREINQHVDHNGDVATVHWNLKRSVVTRQINGRPGSHLVTSSRYKPK
jgi:hypothetical protein